MVYFDERTKSAQALASRLGGIVAESAEALIADPSINAVYICTYHDTHARYAVQAAKAGKHIFIEKPMAITLEDSQTIYDCVEESGVLCMTGFKMRYYPLVSKAKDLLGKTVMLSGQISEKRWPEDNWANDPIKGGGNVLSQGCHAVDMLCHLASSKPIRVYGEARNFGHPSHDIVDALTATIAFESGAIASLTIGDAGVTPFTDKLSFQALDGEKTIHLYERLKHLTYFDGENPHLFSVATEEGFAKENEEFVQALNEERQPQTTHKDGFNATAILLAAFESSKSGCAIDLTSRLKS
jgi:predicted dehydrogenase